MSAPARWERPFVLGFIALVLCVPPAVGELYPFSLPSMFSRAPRKLARYTARAASGERIPLRKLHLLLLLSAAEHRPGRRPGWLREGAILVLAAFYAGAGVAKLRGSGLGWADGTGLQLWMLRLGDQSSQIREWLIADATLAALFAGGVLALELAVLLAPLLPRTRRALGVLLLGLHLGIDLCLHIDFRPQMLLVALVLLPRRAPSAPPPKGSTNRQGSRLCVSS